MMPVISYPNDTFISQRPRHNPPSIIVPNTSTDDSFMDTTDNEKNRDETYVPVTDDDTVDSSYPSGNLSVSLKDVSNCARDFSSGSIFLELNTDETDLIDQVASNGTIGKTKHILGVNSDNESGSRITNTEFMMPVISTQSPRLNPPSISIPNTSTDDSFMDTTDNEKNRDETYVPVTDDDTVDGSYPYDNLLVSLKDLSNCTGDLTSLSILSELNIDETHLIEQVVSNVTVEQTKNILVEDSDNSIIENSETSNMLESPHYHVNMYIPPSESEESFITKNHTDTSQSLLPCQTVPSNTLAQSQYSHSSENSELDDSDRDETFNPASTDSSSDSTSDNTSDNTEVAGLPNTKSEPRPRYLR